MAVISIISKSEANETKFTDKNVQILSVSLPILAIKSPVRLPPKEFEREPLQVGVGLVAQIGTDAFADPGQNVGSRPFQQPGQQSSAGKSRHDPGRQSPIDRPPVLIGEENLVDQRLGQIRGNQANRRAGQRE